MCIGIWSLEHPHYALILGTNRDEFLDRPTQDAHFHAFDQEAIPGSILSGRDEQAGGSWLGINRAGRLALLTNITEPSRKYNTSRGALVSSFLLSTSSHPLEDEVGKIVPKDSNFAGFNLLLLAPVVQSDETIKYDSLYVTNHGGGGELESRLLAPIECSCGGMSNGVDGAGASSWPKVRQATDDFASLLQSLETPSKKESDEEEESALVEGIFRILSWHPDQCIRKREDLRNTVHVEPVPIILEGSSMTAPSYYGTRLSTVVLVSRQGQVLFIERDIWKAVNGKQSPVKADPPTERRFRFIIEPKAGVAPSSTS